MSQKVFKAPQSEVSGCQDQLDLEHFKGKKAASSLGCPRKKSGVKEEQVQSDLPKELSSTQTIPRLFVCVSFSLNSNTLQALSRELKRVGGLMVFRGLIDSSFSKTARRIRELGIDAVIDPTLFRRYNVQRVPTFLIEEQSSGEERARLHDRLAGNVSLSFALSQFSTRGQVKGVESFLKAMDKKP